MEIRGHLVAVVRSKNLTNWTFVKDAFLTKPDWKEKGGIWAPDVVKVNGKYHLYYAYSTWGDPDPGIGLAVADSPAGPFVDHGKLLLSSEVKCFPTQSIRFLLKIMAANICFGEVIVTHRRRELTE